MAENLVINGPNLYAREQFRKQSYFSDIAVGAINSLVPQDFELALVAAIERLVK